MGHRVDSLSTTLLKVPRVIRLHRLSLVESQFAFSPDMIHACFAPWSATRRRGRRSCATSRHTGGLVARFGRQSRKGTGFETLSGRCLEPYRPESQVRTWTRMIVPLGQLYIILWKNVYVKRLRRHYITTILEVALMVTLMGGVQSSALAREPLIRHQDIVYPPTSPTIYWRTRKNISNINTVIFCPDTQYFSRLMYLSSVDLGIKNVVGAKTRHQLEDVIRQHINGTPSVLIGVYFGGDYSRDHVPTALDIHLYPTQLPLDSNVRYGQRLSTQPPGPNKDARYGEMNTILPLLATLERHHVTMVAERRNISFNYDVKLRRFPYPNHIEEHDQKNYGLVLTRFCIGMLVPFAVFVSRLTDERGTGMKEMLRIVGLNDWIYWISHFLSAFFILLLIVTLMMLFLTVKRNEEGRTFIQSSDPLLLFFILTSFCSSCLLQAMLLSLFFSSPASAVAGSMLYWTFSCVIPFMLLENPSGRGYYYIAREEKIWTAIFPGMNLHWCFRVLERFEKYVTEGANWQNFYDKDVTPDNVTLGEILYVGLLTNVVIVGLIWYLDNVLAVGPGVPKPIFFPLMLSYWVPTMSFNKEAPRTSTEKVNFEAEPKDEMVAIQLIQASKDYDGIVAVSGVNLRVFYNQITVLLGHNGAGKTTILNMVAGFIVPSWGNVVVGGYDIKTSTKDARESIGFCNQFNILFDDLTVEEHLLFFAVVKGAPWAVVRTEIATLLRDVGLIEVRSELAINLSLGLQRRLCTALAITVTPKVVVLDEPTAYMDPDGRREMWELLLKTRRRCAIFLTTQHLDEADILGDRVAIMANGRIRCCGSPSFLKQRFGTGYHMQITKLPQCNIVEIEKLLRQYAPKVRLQSDSDNEALFILGQIVATRLIITMFRDLEQRKEDLGFESVGVHVTTLEDVLVRVGEDHHIQRHHRHQDGGDEAAEVIEAKRSHVRAMATNTSASPGCAYRFLALFAKRASYASRQWKMPLFSWLLPPALLFFLLQLEYISSRGGYEVFTFSNRLDYTFSGIYNYAKAFISYDTQEEFVDTYLRAKLLEGVSPTITRNMNVTDFLLHYSHHWLRSYIFDVQVLYQISATNGTTLWYNGQNPHSAILVVNIYNTAVLRNLTKNDTIDISVQLVAFSAKTRDEDEEETRFHYTYKDVVPKVLRSIFFPMISSLMCSSFVVYPVTERVLQVKHLIMMTGVSGFLYWTVSYLWDFLFYTGAAIFLFFPLYYANQNLTPDDTKAVFALNLLHGFAALPATYIVSFGFDNPSFAFSTVAICTFIFTALGSLGAAFIEQVAAAVGSSFLVIILEIVLQLGRLLPSYSYTLGMIKTLQLISENAICRKGGDELERLCLGSAIDYQYSLKKCCEAPVYDRLDAIITPTSVSTYSAFYEMCTLAVEGVVLFVVLVFLESQWARNLERATATPQMKSPLLQLPQAANLITTTTPQMQKEDTDVVEEDKLVQIIGGGGAIDAGVNRPPTAMVVCRFQKSYGYINLNQVLRGLSFALRTGECFGLLGVNGAGKTTAFRILTGELLPDDGDAYIDTYSVLRDTKQFQSYLGYCPQKDGLLDMLTGMETLVLFCRLRGIALAGSDYIDILLDSFHLTEIADQLVETYSTGNRRKLSICVAMIGLPRVLLLDEPYAGIDTTARKRIVNYVSALQRESKIGIVLTSHSMTDVEFLCNRIAILGGGKLQCLGSLAHLKLKFGKGYTITVKIYPDRKHDVFYQRDVVQSVKNYFKRAELVHSYEGLLEFRMTDTRMLWSEMFARMQKIKKRYKLQDFYITDTSLEQIYLSFTRKEAVIAAQASTTTRGTTAPTVAGL